jgi:beta-phosphoglucomutase
VNKAVLFDLDGVLVDACHWHYEALNRALKEVANYIISEEDHFATYNGLPTLTKLKILEDKHIIRKDDFYKISELKQAYTILVIEEFCAESLPKIIMMEHLKSEGYKLGCVTNSIRKTAKLMLKNSGIIRYLDVILSNEDSTFNKPHPEPYIKALVTLNSLPENSVIVEDSPKGLEAARLTGCKVIQVKNATEVTKDLFRGKI